MNRDKISEAGKDYYNKNKEVILEKNRNYYANNKEKTDAKNKEYVESHKEAIIKYKKEYYEKNKLKLQEKIICECGSTCSRMGMSEHKKTKSHMSYQNSLKGV